MRMKFITFKDFSTALANHTAENDKRISSIGTNSRGEHFIRFEDGTEITIPAYEKGVKP